MTEYMNPFTIFALSMAGAAIGAYVGSYLREKGRNLATREDMDNIVVQLRKTTEATEDIKAQISGDLWLRQNRWHFKKDLYARLLENLGSAHRALDHLLDAEMNHPQAESEARKGWLATQRGKSSEALEDVHRASAVAMVILNGEAVSTLRRFEDKLGRAAQSANSLFELLNAQVPAVKEAFDGLKIAAKADLQLEPRPQ